MIVCFYKTQFLKEIYAQGVDARHRAQSTLTRIRYNSYQYPVKRASISPTDSPTTLMPHDSSLPFAPLHIESAPHYSADADKGEA